MNISGSVGYHHITESALWRSKAQMPPSLSGLRAVSFRDPPHPNIHVKFPKVSIVVKAAVANGMRAEGQQDTGLTCGRSLRS